MIQRITLLALCIISLTISHAQQKIIDNSEGLLNGPDNLIVNDDDSKILYSWNGVNFGWYDTQTGEAIATDATSNTPHDLTRVGDMIFMRAKLGTGNPDLVYANINDNAAVHLDYFDAPTFPMMHAQDGLGNYYGGGKYDDDETDADASPNRDFIKLNAAKTTVSQPFNNRFGTASATDNQDLASKLNAVTQIVAFADDKVLVRAYRTTGSADTEFFVYDAGDDVTTQVTDQANAHENTNLIHYPLASPFGNTEIAFYHEDNGTTGIYTTDGLTSTLIATIAATTFDFTSFTATSSEVLWIDTDGGDEELYYSTGTGSTKVDINGSGSSSPRNFVSNGDKVLFVADDGSGNELYHYTGSGAYTKVLFNGSPVSMIPFTNITIPTIEAAVDGFIFIQDSGEGQQVYFTDGVQTVLLDNGYEYDGFIGARQNQTFVSSEYYYFTDNDKDIISVAIPDNIYTGTGWTNGAPALNQSVYINSDITISEDITIHSIHLPENVTITVTNNAIVTIEKHFYNKGTVIEDGGTLDWQEPISTITLNPIIKTVTDFLDTAQIGTAKNQFPEYAITQLTDSLSKANEIKENPQSLEQVELMADSLHAVFIDVLWQKVQEEVVYTNNLEYVLGDLKQAQIQNLLTTENQVDYLLLGMREARFNGIRITLFADGVNPNEEMFDYLYEEAVARGFKIFANPAQSSGGRRVACEMLNGEMCVTRDDPARTNILINRVKAFSNKYKVDWINPFNEDGTPSDAWSQSQMNTIYSTLQNDVNGAELIGPCVWGLPGGIEVLQQTDILNYVSISTSHNLGFNHTLWDSFIALSGSHPVWESEATHTEKDGQASRLLTAVEKGVQGLVFYDNWRTINLSNGSLGGLGLDALSIYTSPATLISDITLSGENKVAIGNSILLSSTILPSNATNTSLAWSSSNTQLATVDQNGLVTGIGNGLVTITATAIDGSGVTGTFEVQSGDIFISDINITGNEEMFIGDTQTLLNEILPTNADDQTFTWSSSNTSIATISLTGELAAISVGSAIITATANDAGGVSETFEITVNPILVSTLVISGAAEMTISGSQTLSATILPEDATDKTFEWSSSNEDILTINSNGLVTANAIGTAVISATANDASEVVGELSIEVTSILVSGIVISGEDEMKVTETQALTTLVFPTNATDNAVIWSSSDVSIATVSTEGLVTPLLPGSVTITATANDASGITDDFEITINPELVTEIDVVGRSAMIPGDTDTFTATIAPADATDKTFVWSSSNPSIATVDVTGLVTAIAVGEVTITATANDNSGVTGSILVTVEAEIIDVSDLTISGNATMTDQSTQTLSVAVLPNDATTKLVSWSSSDEEIATVSQEGLVTAKSTGAVTITATASDGSGISDAFAITVEPLLVTSVSITGSSTMTDRATQGLSAVVTPENATDISVIWSSSDENIATVSTTGLVTAIGIGEITITATASDASTSSGQLVITIEPVLIASIDLTGNESMLIGGTETFTAVTSPENATDATVTWTSSNETLAIVSSTGVVTALGVGTVTITATATDASAISGSIEVTINPVLISALEITGNTTMIDQSTQTLILTATPTNATNQDVTWSSSNEAVATVDDLGVVVAIGVGNVTITATAQDASGISKSIAITVEPLLVSTLEITGSTNLVIGGTQTLVATASPQNATTTNVTWSSSNTEVLTVSATGEVTAIAVGTATVTAAAIDGSGVTQTISIEVSPKLVSEITIDGSQTMIATTTQSLVAQVAPTDATNAAVTWASDNLDVATVNDEGLVTAIATGSAIITATAADGSGISGSIAIEITPLLLSAISITGEASMIDGSTQTLTATVTPTNATDASVVWSSSDESIATVSATGEVTALDPGITTITATANDASGISASLEITVDPILVATISITGNAEITEGETLQLAATITPDNANDASVTWSVDDNALATISDAGLLTSLSPGTVKVTATANDASGISATVDVVINKEIVAGTNPQVSISIYPNPARDLLTITSSGNSGVFDYKLINLSGKIIEEQTINAASQSIDVSQLKRGIYVLTIIADGEETVQKLILD